MKISKTLKDKFATFWKQEISREKIDLNGMNRNKLRLYQKFKSSFAQEPYIDGLLTSYLTGTKGLGSHE